MKLSNSLAYLVAPLLAVTAAAVPNRPHGKPAYFVLAGDSTTAHGGGWGDGFLNTTLRKPAAGINLGHSGATTVSFRDGGDWATVLAEVNNHTASHNVYATIQFGHNDQKPAQNISLAAYATNLNRFATEIRAAKATPILVTSLTRRSFSGTPPRVVEDLANERNATIAVAESLGARYIDLNKASTDYVNAIGQNASWAYNLVPDDRTHLNLWGSVVFGRIVSDLLAEKYKDIAAWTKPNATLTREIREGVPA